MVSLLERLGGAAAVRAIVEEFYTRILADDQLAPFFDNISLTHLRLHQLEFLKTAFTQIPEDMDVGQLMLEKHHKLFAEQGLNETHFDRVAGHFIDTMHYQKVNPELIEEAVAIIAPLRSVFEKGAVLFCNEEKKEELTVVQPQSTLMDRLGGNGAVKAAVEGLYERLLADPELSHFFQGTNMAHLRQHQIQFMKIAFTQIPDTMDVAAVLREKHSRLFAQEGLNEKHFDKVVLHFAATLESLGASDELIQEAAAVITPLRSVFEDAALEAKVTSPRY